MIRTKGLTHTQLSVRDLERSLRFYQRVFGLQERFREGDAQQAGDMDAAVKEVEAAGRLRSSAHTARRGR